MDRRRRRGGLGRVALLLFLAAGCRAPQSRAPDPAPASGIAAETPAPKLKPEEVVLLIHGLGRTRGSLRRLDIYLQTNGFTAIRWGYPSWRYGVEKNAERLEKELARLDASPDVGRIHIVGHSLGGILARVALSKRVPRKMGRMVMLAPPNRGSPRARAAAPWVGWLIPSLGELADRPDSYVQSLRTIPGVEIGVIAGSRDGTVPPSQTHLVGERGHLVVKSGHTFIMNKPIVLQQVVKFLREGRFDRPL